MLEKANSLGITNVTLVGNRWVGIGQTGDLFVYQKNYRVPRWVRFAAQRFLLDPHKQQKAA